MNRLLAVCTLLMVSAAYTHAYAEPKEGTGTSMNCTCNAAPLISMSNGPREESDINHVPCTQSTPSGDEQNNLSDCTKDVAKPGSTTITPGIVSPVDLAKELDRMAAIQRATAKLSGEAFASAA